MMKSILHWAAKVIAKLNSSAGFLAGYAVIIMDFVVLYAVIMRYGFDRPPMWTTETSGFMLMFITFLPLGFVLQNNMHIKVDFIAMRFSDKTQKKLDIFNSFLGAAFTAILFWQSCRLVSTAFKLDWVTIETQTPLGYPLLMMPLGCAILFFSCLIKGLSQLIAHPDQKES